MISELVIRERFGDIWPHHNAAFNDLLIRCRRAFDGDLDKMAVLSVIGERTLTTERAAGISYDRFLDGRRGLPCPRPINIQSISECTGIPRETVRRKIAQLIDKGGWNAMKTACFSFCPKPAGIFNRSPKPPSNTLPGSQTSSPAWPSRHRNHRPKRTDTPATQPCADRTPLNPVRQSERIIPARTLPFASC